MRVAMLGLCVLLASCAGPQTPVLPGSQKPRPPAVPADVAAFITTRDSCEHFMGEEPYDAERRMFLAARIAETCTGSDEQLAALRAKYVQDKNVLVLLAGYEAL